MVLALGATAAPAVTGRAASVLRERGRPLALADGATAMLTFHPSYLLRLPGREAAV